MYGAIVCEKQIIGISEHQLLMKIVSFLPIFDCQQSIPRYVVNDTNTYRKFDSNNDRTMLNKIKEMTNSFMKNIQPQLCVTVSE